jgi:hypothetical protein
MEHARAEHLRKLVTGACLIAAPAVLIVGEAIHPDEQSDAAEMMATIAGGLDRWYWAHVIVLLGMLLTVGAVLGLAHMLHERRPLLAFVGGGLAIAGVLFVSAIIGADGFAGYFVARESAATPEGVAVMDGLLEGGRMMALYVPALLLSVGVAVLGVGLWQTRVAAKWEAGLVMAGAVVMGVGFPAGSRPVVLAGMVLLLAGLAPIGYGVLTESDEEWAHTPDFHGLRRPVATGT